MLFEVSGILSLSLSLSSQVLSFPFLNSVFLFFCLSFCLSFHALCSPTQIQGNPTPPHPKSNPNRQNTTQILNQTIVTKHWHTLYANPVKTLGKPCQTPRQTLIKPYLGVISELFELHHGLHDDVAHARVAEDGHILSGAHKLCLLERLAIPLNRITCK